jgi:hypothetical protein
VPIVLHHDSLRFGHSPGDARDRAVGFERRDVAGLDVAEEQSAIVVEGEVIGCREILKQDLRA